MGASHLEHATLSSPSLSRTLFVNLCPAKRVDTGPSFYFWKYNCFSFDLHVYRLILNCHIGRVWGTDLRPASPVGNRPISTYQNSVSNKRPQNEALGNKPHKLCIYSPEPCTELYCLRLNFNISKLVYWHCKTDIVILGLNIIIVNELVKTTLLLQINDK